MTDAPCAPLPAATLVLLFDLANLASAQITHKRKASILLRSHRGFDLLFNPRIIQLPRRHLQESTKLMEPLKSWCSRKCSSHHSKQDWHGLVRLVEPETGCLRRPS